ncbi:MAG: UDP-N-acetylmuramoyl-L-alanine--D-glutamate ligase [Erysipelotrichaceae bacterium]|nr:UDP-N-acetylmuramoyl-L-alanine--D-glutamate ligase [Erysipelotrichaceae bacterium]
MKELLLEEFKDKKVLIWGLGREGNSTYRLLRSLLPDQLLYICDNKADLSSYDNTVKVLQEDLVFDDYDIIMKAPGIICDRHDNITGQTDIFLKHFKNNVIGITGTKGKSTTSSLTYHILHNYYPNSFLVGNIGVPCFEILDKMNEDSIVVFELGCHQLEFSKHSPHVAIILNIYEEHLDHYHTFENYYQTKLRAVRYQNENDIALINMDIEYDTKAKVYLLGKDIRNENNALIFNDDRVIIEDTRLIGEHNYYNMAICYAIGRLYGLSDDDIKKAIASFKPLEHRLEPFLKVNGITYVNDSISTINETCIMAIKALKDVDTVLIGGLDRHIDYHLLEDFIGDCDVKHIILMYDSGRRIYDEMKDKKGFERCYLVEDLQQACDLAISLCHSGICLLSPAAASYDHFKNFEERGAIFKAMVKKHYGLSDN